MKIVGSSSFVGLVKYRCGWLSPTVQRKRVFLQWTILLFSPYEAHVSAGRSATDITHLAIHPPPAAVWTTFQLDGDSDKCGALETAVAWLSLTSIFPRQATSMAAGQTAAGAAGVSAVKWFVTRVKEWAAVHAGDWARALGLHGPHRHQAQNGGENEAFADSEPRSRVLSRTSLYILYWLSASQLGQSVGKVLNTALGSLVEPSGALLSFLVSFN